ncbi:hypothetical protein BgAZ_100550 [Babesia gibsoni]|uniref:Vesicle transport v-SNARE N-terminal domain-containing protein n=1 Tax=Babesia gibsoni TaxID=33632 RepID=A0AAD8UV58_BABGI|nr:hypothetical protein BgAZ_100550 [Babesia gibsoni]
MGDLFEEYNRHVSRILDTVEEQLKTCEIGSLGTAASQRHNLDQLDRTLASADETVRQFELEARASDSSLYSARVGEIKRVKSVLKNAANRSKALKIELERAELMGGGGNIYTGGHYRTLHDSDQLLHKGTEYIQASYAMAQETEMIGAGAAEELYAQRNVIYNVQNRMRDMKFTLDDADEYLTRLLKQGRLNRVILRAVIGGMIVAATLIVLSRTLRYLI